MLDFKPTFERTIRKLYSIIIPSSIKLEKYGKNYLRYRSVDNVNPDLTSIWS